MKSLPHLSLPHRYSTQMPVLHYTEFNKSHSQISQNRRSKKVHVCKKNWVHTRQIRTHTVILLLKKNNKKNPHTEHNCSRPSEQFFLYILFIIFFHGQSFTLTTVLITFNYKFLSDKTTVLTTTTMIFCFLGGKCHFFLSYIAEIFIGKFIVYFLVTEVHSIRKCPYTQYWIQHKRKYSVLFMLNKHLQKYFCLIRE